MPQSIDFGPALEILFEAGNECYNTVLIPIQARVADLRFCDLALALVLALPLLIFFSFIIKNRYRKNHLLETSRALEAILAVLVPNASRWPARYISIAKQSIHTRRILLPLSELINDIASGTIELRDSSVLAELIGSQICVYGYLIRLHVCMAWRIKVWSQLLSWYTYPVPPQLASVHLRSHFQITRKSEIKPSSTLHTTPDKDLEAFQITVKDNSTVYHYTAARVRADDTAPGLCLDHMPHSQMKLFIRAAQAALQPGDRLAIEFTAVSPAVTFLSDCFLLCAIPFIPSRLAPVEAPLRFPTSTPLLTSFHRILDLLSSGPDPLAICSIHNLSEMYATQLRADVRAIEEHGDLRAAMVEQIGMNHWRWLKLITDWKTGLLTAGKIVTWMVIVQKTP